MPECPLFDAEIPTLQSALCALQESAEFSQNMGPPIWAALKAKPVQDQDTGGGVANTKLW